MKIKTICQYYILAETGFQEQLRKAFLKHGYKEESDLDIFIHNLN